MAKIRVVIKEPRKDAYVKFIKAKLESFQEIVQGNIEGVGISDELSERNIIAYCNDEGKIMGYRLNIYIQGRRDIISGNCVFVKGNDEGEDISLNDEDITLIKNYCDRNEL